MGQMYDVTCGACGHCFEQAVGGGWSWYNKICKDCGTLRPVPRNAMWIEDQNEQGVALATPEAMQAYLNDRSLWRRGPGFSDQEKEILSALTARCTCGGEMVMEPADVMPQESNAKRLHRCPECRSNELNFIPSGLLFD